jgi:3-hydroxyisobutyrate dehydrogenase-like beta-hydroxyacid dehydrogenase
MKVGFIGLGRMGRGMAGRVLTGGHDLVVFNRTREKTSELANAGARVAGSIAGACEGREVVITMLTDDAALREVTLSTGALRDSLPSGAIHLTMGTHSTQWMQELASIHAASNQTFVAAPVLGRPDMAASGQLGIVAGGPADALEKCDPLFRLMGRHTFYAGQKPEHAIAIKLSNNFLLGCALGAMAEGFSLVRKYGVAPQVFYEVMTESLFSAPVYKVYGKIMVDEAYDKVGFTTLLGLKDFNLIMAAADLARVPLPSGNAFRDRLLGAVAHGDGEKDWAVVAREQARASRQEPA